MFRKKLICVFTSVADPDPDSGQKLSWLKISLLGQRLLLEPICPLKGFQKIYMTALDKKTFSLALKNLDPDWMGPYSATVQTRVRIQQNTWTPSGCR
jgi:hypothetical protein